MEALIFIGLPGAGKSTFYRSLFFQTHIRINLDMLRTRRRESVLIGACLEAKQRFVWDNTNASRAERAGVILRAKEARFRVHAFYFAPDLLGSIARNARRRGAARIPIGGIHATRARLQMPQFDEGFNSIFTVRIGLNGKFLIDET